MTKIGHTKSKTRIYLRGGWWWIYYRLNERTVQRSLRTSSRVEAEALQRQAEMELLAGRLDVRPRITVEDYREWFEIWLETNNRRPKTRIQYRWALDRFFGVAAWDHLDSYTSADADRFKRAMRTDGLKPQSVNSALRHVKAFFERAELAGFIERNPFRRVPMLRVERKVPKFLTALEVEWLLGCLKFYPPYDLVVCLGALCGFRVGEIGAATWDWFDFKNNTITLASRKDFQLKDWQARTVPLSAWALSIVEPRRKGRGYVVKFEGRKRTGPQISFKRSWPKLVAAAGLPGVTLKQLRSTFGTLYLRQGVPRSKIADWMGHSSEDVTRRHYAQLDGYDSDIEHVRRLDD